MASHSTQSARRTNLVAASRVAEAVAVVSRRPIIGGTCLPSALTTWFLLRRRGIDAIVVIGADTPNLDRLSAHAWVEVEGVPLNEPADIGDRLGSFGLELPQLPRHEFEL